MIRLQTMTLPALCSLPYQQAYCWDFTVTGSMTKWRFDVYTEPSLTKWTKVLDIIISITPFHPIHGNHQCIVDLYEFTYLNILQEEIIHYVSFESGLFHLAFIHIAESIRTPFSAIVILHCICIPHCIHLLIYWWMGVRLLPFLVVNHESKPICPWIHSYVI
jgi:hypothetical protein